MSIVVMHDRDELQRLVAATDASSRAVVMTMGALHDGHAALIRAARNAVGLHGTVIVTVYVNALQFNDADDLARYPRTLDADVLIAERAGADVVWAPQPHDVFPDGSDAFTTDASDFETPYGPLGDILEGAARPGHFTGMLTVVRALLAATTPAKAFFGEKDYQQLALIRRMVQAYALAAEVVGVPTVREPDGLALSSRNRFLDAHQRAQALALHAALTAAAHDCASAERAIASARKVIANADLQPDYIAVVGEDFTQVPVAGQARMLIACKVGDVRLIDNAPLMMGENS